MNQYTFHVLGVPFTATSRRYLGDAMTQNVFNMCRLLSRLGHRVYHYGNFGSDADCTEHVEIFHEDEMNALYSQGTDYRFAPNGFYIKGTDAVYREFVRRVAPEVLARASAGEFLLGVRYPHPEVMKQCPDLMYVHHSVGHMEPGPPATIFASEYIRNLNLGVQLAHTKNLAFDPRSAVIPHFVFSEDFEYSDESDDYFLFLGRLSREKGLETAINICKQLGKRLLIAGQGDIRSYGELPSCCEYLGYTGDAAERNRLLAKASALLMTSRYEAFGMSAIEALMCGTPILTPDFSSFPEINEHGVTGFRCATVGEYLVAAGSLQKISRKACRQWAERRFTSDVVGPTLQHYFERLVAIRNGCSNDRWMDAELLAFIAHN
jgi:glycosyltransferase involved in cell wall biosynthesis